MATISRSELDAARDFVRECLIIESSLREYAVTDPYGQDDAYIIDRLVKLDGVLVQVDGAVKLILDAIRPDAVVEAARCPERSYHEVGIAIARRTASWARSPIVNAARLARPWNAPNLSFPLPVLSEPLTADNLARCWTPRTWDRLRDVLLVIPNYNRDLFFKQIDAEHALACKAIAVGSPTLPRSSADGWMPVGRAVEIAQRMGLKQVRAPNINKWGARGNILVRPRELPGAHKAEVYWPTLIAFLANTAETGKAVANSDEPNATQREAINENIAAESKKRRAQRPA